MKSQFETTIADLWRALGMAPPRFAAENRIVLQVDGDAVVLREAPDAQHVLIVGRAGELAREAQRSAEQVSDILRANLANASGFSACVSLENADSETPEVVVQGRYAYRDRNIEKLAAQIQEVAHLRGIHGARLSGVVRTSNSLSHLADIDSEATIFRP